MACHPSGIVVDLVGINACDQGRSCEAHACCGKEIIAKDVVVRFRAVQLERSVVNEANPEAETTALAVYHVTEGIDGCRVGFLRRHLLKYVDEYDGRLGQVTEVLDPNGSSPSDRAKAHRNMGCALVVLIEAEYRDFDTPEKKRLKTK